MEQIRAWISTLSLATLAVAALIGVGGTILGSAHAEGAVRPAVCTALKASLAPKDYADALQAWMNDRLLEGRSHFVTMPNQYGLGPVCAW